MGTLPPSRKESTETWEAHLARRRLLLERERRRALWFMLACPAAIIVGAVTPFVLRAAWWL